MRQLWMEIPPFLSDTFGFEEVMNQTEGIGILDDCSDYKGRAGRLSSGREHGPRRMVSTGIRMEDAVSGTGKKIRELAEICASEQNPDFMLLAAGPVSAMIGTDFEALAEKISAEHRLPVSWVELNGHRYYDVGLGRTLEKLASLLTRPMECVPGTCSLLGSNEIDCGKNAGKFRDWAKKQGYEVISQWGVREATANLRRAAAAEVNLVTASCGLPLARYLKKMYGTPFVAGVPYGETWSSLLHDAMRGGRQPKQQEGEPEGPEILIIGEQLTANAVRETLRYDFYKQTKRNIQAATFFQMDKEFSEPDDRKLKGEDDLRKLMNQGRYELIIGAPEFKRLWDGRGRFIVLPHGAVSMNCDEEFPELIGDNLNRWLNWHGVMEGL